MAQHLAVITINRTHPTTCPCIWILGVNFECANLQQLFGKMFLCAHTSAKPTPKPTVRQPAIIMDYYQKIYYTNKPLILTNDARSYIREHPLASGYLLLTGAFPRNFRLGFDHLDKFHSLGCIIEDISQEALQEELHKLYEPIDAAGGVVQNEDGNVLMIYRRGKWDLPKGKRDEGEEMDACALREVSEETGLHQLKLGDKICDTYHIYSQHNQALLKRTAWYHMEGTTKEQLVPQAEENIEEAKWISADGITPILRKTYDAIKEVLKEAGCKW